MEVINPSKTSSNVYLSTRVGGSPGRVCARSARRIRLPLATDRRREGNQRQWASRPVPFFWRKHLRPPGSGRSPSRASPAGWRSGTPATGGPNSRGCGARPPPPPLPPPPLPFPGRRQGQCHPPGKGRQRRRSAEPPVGESRNLGAAGPPGLYAAGFRRGSTRVCKQRIVEEYIKICSSRNGITF